MDKHVFTDKQKKLIAWAAIAIFLLLSAAVGWFIGRPLVRFASRPEEFRLWVDGHGLLGMAAYVGMVFLQVVVAVIPGEPLEISGGYAFGALRGSVLCLLGGVLGSVAVFALVRRFGRELVEIFFPREKLEKLKFLQSSPKRDALFWLIFTVPGTPKDLLCYFAGLTDLSWGSNRMHFTYDSTGPASVTYNGNRYFYLKNAQGDVTGLVNASGTQVVSYTYDPWGASMSTDGTMAATLGAANPLRYRGYVYDTETGLYYLSSRYYNPVWGRFINADGYASTGQGFTGDNMFAYCNDNPVNYNDSEGTYPLRNTMTMMTDTGGNTPKPKYSAAVPIGTGAASSAVNAVAEQTLKPKVVPVSGTVLKEAKNFGPVAKALKSSKVPSAAFALPFTIASIISDFKHYEGLGVALSVFVDILNPVICIMIGGFIAANFCAFPAVFISIAAGVAVDGFFYVLKDRFLKAYRKKGKT